MYAVKAESTDSEWKAKARTYAMPLSKRSNQTFLAKPSEKYVSPFELLAHIGLRVEGFFSCSHQVGMQGDEMEIVQTVSDSLRPAFLDVVERWQTLQSLFQVPRYT